jgi:hypothetical protein
LFKVFHDVLARLGRILKPAPEGPPAEWCLRLDRMKKCLTAEQMVNEFGEPAHKLPMGEMEVWHYPLGIDGGVLYSIHAVEERSVIRQVYMYFVASS